MNSIYFTIADHEYYRAQLIPCMQNEMNLELRIFPVSYVNQQYIDGQIKSFYFSTLVSTHVNDIAQRVFFEVYTKHKSPPSVGNKMI